ncbi:hypothetical protein [Pedobacter sp. MR2016-24]|uniref:hypothetical protein n=1 Tax=Pedobacter sp. MR2016-24 TaxID=2994466 RepID=UPI00224519D5|nr:hypothetical protein [Pedobacter sp. MR2016-24]MCX2486563.1 hypothetical protein [Pedobacter sp. MR2016-24]
MKNLLLLPGFLLLFMLSSCNGTASPLKAAENRTAVDTAQLIKTIKAEYAAINNGSFTKKKKDLSGLSAEGGELITYYKKLAVVKEHAILYGEMGKVEIDLYYNATGLFFVYKKETFYDQPMYVKGSKVKSLTQNRYYFHKGGMIRWIGTDHRTVSPGSTAYREEAGNVMELAAQIKAQRN